MPPAQPVAVAPVVIGQLIVARVVDDLVRGNGPFDQPGHSHERLDRRPRRIAAPGRPVEQRQIDIALQPAVGLDVDTGDKLVGVEPRHRGHRQNFAGLGRDGDDGATPAIEQIHSELLHVHVQGQGQVLTRLGVGVPQLTQHPPPGVGLDLSQPRTTVQLILVEAFHPGLADKVGTGVVARIQALELFGVDPAHVAKRMGHDLGVGIEAQQLGLHLHSRQAVAIDRKPGDLRLGQITHQQRRLVGTLTLA